MQFDDIRSEFTKLEDFLRDGPMYPSGTAEEIRSHLRASYGFSGPLTLDRVTADVERMMVTWQTQVTNPRYFGLFNPSVTLAGVLAETIVALYNPQLAAWRTSPAANEIERHTLAWLAARFGLPVETQATFTTGGAEANLTAVIVALTRAFPDYSTNGLRSLNSVPTIYATAETHHSFRKIAHMTGLGRNALRLVPAGRDSKMIPAELEKLVAADRRSGFSPLMVIGTGGTTTAGAIDPLPEIGRFCRAAGIWFHADAAWGGAAILSPSLRHHLAGIELADSITCDAHKWFSVPMGCGMFFCRHPESVGEAFRVETSYMPGRPADSAIDPYTSTVQWSRRFIGLKLFMSLAERGADGYAAMIDRQAQLGSLLRELLIDSGWRIVNDTPLPVVCFTRDGLDIPAFLASLREQQIAWMSESRIAETPVVRACITSFKTTEDDVRSVVGALNRIASQNTMSAAIS
jgi:glutamate/tyrosine decarboxylase-like PLP-dependent enzyme